MEIAYTWNVSNVYTSGSLTIAARELARYKLELVSVKEVGWDKGGTFLWKRKRIL